jgi:hypothetical protein
MKKLLTLAIILVIKHNSIYADEYFLLTLDNDIFLSDDSGYTNGLYASFANGQRNQPLPPAWLTQPLQWSIANQPATLSYNVTTFGQTIVTPSDISLEIPDPKDIPYSGLLFFHQANVQEFGHFADKASVTLGIVGPSSGAEKTQRQIHRLTGSEIPQGWDYQLKDEIVFQISRGRVYRSWHNQQESFDLLIGVDSKIGTLETALTGGMMFRIGENMSNTYSSALLNFDRASNPMVIDQGWYGYIGVATTYLFHLIYLDGNTFRDSPSIDYSPMQFNGFMGFAYAWRDFSISLAVNNINVFSNNKQFGELKQYGSITWMWRL